MEITKTQKKMEKVTNKSDSKPFSATFLMFCMVLVVGILCGTLLINAVSDSSKDVVDYKDKGGVKDKIAILKDQSNKPIAEAELLTPMHHYVGTGKDIPVMIYEFDSTINKLNALKDVEIINMKNKQLESKNFKWGCPEYINQEYDVYSTCNGNTTCQVSKIGSSVELKQVGWKECDDTNIKQGITKIALLTDVEEGDVYDGVWVLDFGKEQKISKHAIWNSTKNVGLMAYWKMDDASKVLDSVNGTFRNINWLGSVPVDNPTGIINSCAEGNGAPSGNTTINSSTSDPRSYSFWFLIPNKATADNDGVIGNIQTGTSDNFYMWYDNSPHEKFRFSVVDATTFTINDVWWSEADTLRENTWIHAVLTFDGVDAWKIYINGTELTWTDGTGTLGGSNQNVYLMSRGLLDGDNFTGNFDEVGIWSRVLSDSEILDLYNNGLGLSYVKTTEIFTVNSQTYNTTTYETSTENFIINFTYNSTIYTSITGTFYYNGTSYAGTKVGTGDNLVYKRELPINSSYSPKVTFNWEFSLTNSTETYVVNSSIQTQIVGTPLFELCNSTSTSRYLNISFADETDSSRINATVTTSTWTYYLNDVTLNKTYSFSNATQNWEYNFCFLPLDRTINVIPSFSYKQGTDYPQRTWNPGLKSYTNGTANQTLYLLSDDDGRSITFQVVNPANEVLSNVLVVGTTSIGGVSTIVARGTTDSAGTITFWLNPDVSHTFNFSRTGFTTQTETIIPTQTNYIITMGEVSTILVTDYSLRMNISLEPSKDTQLYNDTTYNFNMSITSGYWTLEGFGFSLRLSNGTTLDSVSSSANGGMVSINLDTLNYSRIIMEYNWTVNGTTLIRRTSWNVFNTGYTQWSIGTFFTDLNTYLNTDMFGLDDFGRTLIVYFILFLSIGIMSYRYGLVSPMAITTMVFGVIYFFDVVTNILPSPLGAIPNFFTWITGSILAVVIIREVMRG